MLSREERILTEILVARGLVAQERIEACARSRRADPSSASLVDTLIDTGDLARHDAEQVREEARSLEEALAPELPAGKMLGEFRLLREIGRGGMGIVYEAQQEPLGRRVALKVLPAGAALDERLSIRFLREARAVAGLRHPGIVPVYTSGRAEGVLYFAMELIEGRSLAAALEDGPLSPVEAARIGAEIARALEHAHASGLVHRDVKPENILLASDGQARIADFGLVYEASARALTVSHHILGTPAFIAPEQARGEAVDPKSDVYSLGAVLYAMLAGAPPFAGEVPSLVLTRVLAARPRPLEAARSGLPREVIRICERAMARDPSARYATAGALAADLERFQHSGTLGRTLPRAWRRPALVAAGAVGALAVVLAVLARRAGSASPPVSARPPEASFRMLVESPGRKRSPALSPDGRWLAYASDLDGDWDIYLRDLDHGSEAVNLTADSPAEDLFPAFSPDGRQLAFASVRGSRAVYVMDLTSRQPRKIADQTAGALSWSSDGREIVLTDRAEDIPGASTAAAKLWALDVSSGRRRPLTGMYAAQPQASGASGRVAFVSQGGGQTDLWTVPESGGNAVRVTGDDAVEWSPVWSSDGRRLYYGSDRGGTLGLWTVAVDREGQPTGAPRRIEHAVVGAPFYLAMARNRDRIVFAGLEASGTLYRLTLAGSLRGVAEAVVAFPRRFLAVQDPDVSRDGRLAFIAITSQEDLAVREPSGDEPRLLTHDAAHDRGPRWSPDGSTIAFQSDRDGRMQIWLVRPDGSDLRRLTETPADVSAPVWSPDGASIAYSIEGRAAFTTPAVRGAGSAAPKSFPAPANGGEGFEPSAWSPDGGTLAGTARGVVLYSPEERRYRRLTDAGGPPIWLDERWLAVAAKHEIELLDSKTGKSTPIFSFAPGGVEPRLAASADGRTIFASVSSSAEAVWSLEITE